MTRRLLVATTNPGKVREVAAALAPVAGLSVLSLRDLPPIPEVPELGRTFAENACAKAEGYARASGLPALADDSGLSVDALGGEPGVRSARYGGEGLDDPGRCRLVLERLAGLPAERRTARFECALALAVPVVANVAGEPAGERAAVSDADRTPIIGAGSIPRAGSASITSAGPPSPVAAGGGTPVCGGLHRAVTIAAFTGTVEGRITESPRGENGFGYDPIFLYPPYGRTLAEVTLEEKQAVSHRGRALAALRAWIEGGGLARGPA